MSTTPNLATDLDNVVEGIKELLKKINIIHYRDYRPIRDPKGQRIRNVQEFREMLFETEIAKIKGLLGKTGRITDVANLLGELAKLSKNTGNVALNAFINNYEARVAKILNGDDPLYSSIMRRAMEIFREKEREIPQALRTGKIVHPKTILSLFIASFVVATIMEMLEGQHRVGEVKDVVSDFLVDFIYGFSYLETRAHTTITFDSNVENVIRRVEKLVSNKLELKKVYGQIRNMLRSERFPYDIGKIATGTRYVFDKEWDSLIIICYPEAARKYQIILNDWTGATAQLRRLASVLYMEFMISKDRKEMLFIVNKPLSALEKGRKLRDILDNVLRHVLGTNLKYLLERKQNVYSVPADKFVEEVRKALSGKPRSKLSEALDNFKKTLVERSLQVIDSEEYRYGYKLKEFIKTLKLSSLYFRLVLERRVLMRIELELSDLSDKGFIQSKDLVELSNAVRLLAERARSIYTKAYKKLGSPTPVIGVVLEGTIEGQAELSRIEFTSDGSVFFHRMNREYVTELSHILWSVARKWNIEKKS